MHALFGENILRWIVEQIKPILIALVTELVTELLTPKAEPLPPIEQEDTTAPTDTADGDVPMVD